MYSQTRGLVFEKKSLYRAGTEVFVFYLFSDIKVKAEEACYRQTAEIREEETKCPLVYLRCKPGQVCSCYCCDSKYFICCQTNVKAVWTRWLQPLEEEVQHYLSLSASGKLLP